MECVLVFMFDELLLVLAAAPISCCEVWMLFERDSAAHGSHISFRCSFHRHSYFLSDLRRFDRGFLDRRVLWIEASRKAWIRVIPLTHRLGILEDFSSQCISEGPEIWTHWSWGCFLFLAKSLPWVFMPLPLSCHEDWTSCFTQNWKEEVRLRMVVALWVEWMHHSCSSHNQTRPDNEAPRCSSKVNVLRGSSTPTQTSHLSALASSDKLTVPLTVKVRREENPPAGRKCMLESWRRPTLDMAFMADAFDAALFQP